MDIINRRSHVVPIEDFDFHVCSDECWCHPLVKDNGSGNKTIVHNAKDAREKFERQNIRQVHGWTVVIEKPDE